MKAGQQPDGPVRTFSASPRKGKSDWYPQLGYGQARSRPAWHDPRKHRRCMRRAGGEMRYVLGCGALQEIFGLTPA